jgi:hypothetical protein
MPRWLKNTTPWPHSMRLPQGYLCSKHHLQQGLLRLLQGRLLPEVAASNRCLRAAWEGLQEAASP